MVRVLRLPRGEWAGDELSSISHQNVGLLMVDILVIHRKAHVIRVREAAIEAAVWVSFGLAFALVL